MRCIYCGFVDSKVLDSRSVDDGNTIRRRRECLKCAKRFTTYEVVETTPILVIKNDGTREQFDPMKIKKGIIKAVEKRPVKMQEIDTLVNEIEKQVLSTLEEEVPSKKIGELVMRGLRSLDQVAYIRFASVYRQFRDVTTFVDFINEDKDKEKTIELATDIDLNDTLKGE